MKAKDKLIECHIPGDWDEAFINGKRQPIAGLPNDLGACYLKGFNDAKKSHAKRMIDKSKIK